MKSLLIMAPHRAVSARTLGGVTALPNGTVPQIVSQNPREAAEYGSGTPAIIIDLGRPRLVDCAYIGYNTFPDGSFVANITISNDPDVNSNNQGRYYGHPGDGSTAVGQRSALNHGFVSFAPAVGRYVYISITTAAPVSATVGIVAVGESFVSQWGQEFGAGRTLGDTSTVERLASGSFGIDQGVVYGGYQWTFGDLSGAEREALFDIVKRVGIGRPLLIVEDPDFNFGVVAGRTNAFVENQIITKAGGSNAAFDAEVSFGPVNGDGAILDWKGDAARSWGGFYAAPSSGQTTAIYAVFTEAGAAYRYSGGTSVVIATGAAPNDRYELEFNGFRFTARRNGVLIDALAADPVTAPLYGSIYLYTVGSTASEVRYHATGLDERLHWGLLQRLEPYERIDPRNTKWSLQIGDWA